VTVPRMIAARQIPVNAARLHVAAIESKPSSLDFLIEIKAQVENGPEENLNTNRPLGLSALLSSRLCGDCAAE